MGFNSGFKELIRDCTLFVTDRQASYYCFFVASKGVTTTTYMANCLR